LIFYDLFNELNIIYFFIFYKGTHNLCVIIIKEDINKSEVINLMMN
jgi:hypothetical protein